MDNWMEELRALPAESIFVQHNPPGARDERALAKMPYLISQGEWIGVKDWDMHPDSGVELALWAPHPEGRRCGLYACFRIEYDDQGPYRALHSPTTMGGTPLLASRVEPRRSSSPYNMDSTRSEVIE